MSRELGVPVKRLSVWKQRQKDESKVTVRQHPSPSLTSSSSVMLFIAKLLDSVNTLNACVKFKRESRGRFSIIVIIKLPPLCKMRSDDRLKDTNCDGRMCYIE